MNGNGNKHYERHDRPYGGSEEFTLGLRWSMFHMWMNCYDVLDGKSKSRDEDSSDIRSTKVATKNRLSQGFNFWDPIYLRQV